MNKAGFDSFYIFQSVMRYGSFTGAAAAEGTTTENVAEEINRLESVLDMALFNPGSGGTVPTAGGLFLYDKLDNLLWNLEAILQQAKAIPPEDNMKLVLGISEMIASSCYRDLLQTFIRRYPKVDLVLRTLYWSDVRRLLAEGKVDAVLTYSMVFTEEQKLQRKALTRSKPCIFYTEQLISEKPENVTLDSFRNCPFVCLNTDVAARNMLTDLPYEPRKVYFTENLKSLQLYVISGLACTVLSRSQQLEEIEGVRLFENPYVDYVAGADIVWDKSNRNPAIELLSNCIGQTVPPLPKRDPKIFA